MDPAHQPDPSSSVLVPLTRGGSAGRYRRSAEVEAQLQDALTLSASALRERAGVTDPHDPAFLREESLVYLIRNAHRRGDELLVSALAERLLRRCARWIETRLQSLAPDAAEEGYAAVVAALFTPILDLESDRGDFLQVRFWVVLDRLVITAHRAQVRRLTRAKREVPLARLSGDDGPGDADGDEPRRGERVSDDHWAATPALDERWVDHPVILDALAGLTPRAQEAFILKHAAGWPVESNDPAVMTISRALRVTGRTVRNDLAAAEAHVMAWRQGAAHLR